MQGQQPPQGSKISNFEWGLYLGALATIDIVQFVLDMFVVGVVANRFIDIATGMIKTFYLWVRGVRLDSKKIWALIGAFIFEEVPGLDALPLWTLDGVMDMVWDKADKKILSKVPGAEIATMLANRHERISNVNADIKKQAEQLKGPEKFASNRLTSSPTPRGTPQYLKNHAETSKSFARAQGEANIVNTQYGGDWTKYKQGQEKADKYSSEMAKSQSESRTKTLDLRRAYLNEDQTLNRTANLGENDKQKAA